MNACVLQIGTACWVVETGFSWGAGPLHGFTRGEAALAFRDALNGQPVATAI